MDQNQTVLLIEDDEDILNLMKVAFETRDIPTWLASSGEDGLRVALEKKPYLILLDMNMPGMDGLAFLKELRKDAEYGATARVIMLTNLADKEKMAELSNLNIIDYIVKSNWDVMEIADKVKSIVSP